jgi:hypothetical protein
VQVSANPDNVAMVSLGVAYYIQSRDPQEAQYSTFGTC